MSTFHVVFEFTPDRNVTEEEVDRAGGRLGTYGATIAHGAASLGVTVCGDYRTPSEALGDLSMAVTLAFNSLGIHLDFYSATVYTSEAFDTKEVQGA